MNENQPSDVGITIMEVSGTIRKPVPSQPSRAEGETIASWEAGFHKTASPAFKPAVAHDYRFEGRV